jgi:site-specific DNA-methyltransferase (adenine-specific)
VAALSSKFGSAKQDWETPSELFDPINYEFQFTLDAAASPSNAKVKNFITAEQDGMAADWGKNTVWLNPPYGDRQRKLSDWVKKSAQAARAGATVVMLIPARTNTNWFHDICLKHAEVRFVRGRPKFVGADEGLPQPLCLVIFRPQ